MQSASIADDFEEGADMDSGLFDRRMSFAVHFLLHFKVRMKRSALALS